MQRKGVAKNGDCPLGAGHQHGRSDVRRRHEPVWGLVMLVHRHAVEPHLVVVDQLIEVGLVELMALLGVVERIRHRDPRGVTARDVGRSEVRPRHQVEADDLHFVPVDVDSGAVMWSMALRKRSVCSIWGRCPASEMMTGLAWGRASSQASKVSTGTR